MIEWCGWLFVMPPVRTDLISYEVPPVNVECPYDISTDGDHPGYSDVADDAEPLDASP